MSLVMQQSIGEQFGSYSYSHSPVTSPLAADSLPSPSREFRLRTLSFSIPLGSINDAVSPPERVSVPVPRELIAPNPMFPSLQRTESGHSFQTLQRSESARALQSSPSTPKFSLTASTPLETANTNRPRTWSVNSVNVPSGSISETCPPPERVAVPVPQRVCTPDNDSPLVPHRASAANRTMINCRSAEITRVRPISRSMENPTPLRIVPQHRTSPREHEETTILSPLPVRPLSPAPMARPSSTPLIEQLEAIVASSSEENLAALLNQNPDKRPASKIRRGSHLRTSSLA
eukprot:TRINITY_DN5836_c0_g1_i2.p1 TRINITY_DN5836_c0_g1~~TRINITY_DN5836_c0_g1_i2.p1  ORF type:complete len:290 (+),score=36.03 TRINITY_DN5836_c0_g1_i2:141-1010(+)